MAAMLHHCEISPSINAVNVWMQPVRSATLLQQVEHEVQQHVQSLFSLM